ncbi:MAG: MalY/PatB family protein [Anaerolineae bacterium]
MIYDLDRFIDRRGTESAKWSYFESDVIPLWVADMDFVSPAPVIQALEEIVQRGVFGYGIEPPELRGILVDRLLERYQWRIQPEDIVFLPGVISGFNLACRALTEPSDAVIVQAPVYGPILGAAKDSGRQGQVMALTRCDDGRYVVDDGLFESTISAQTRLFLMCNPHNPVGRVYTRPELERMAEICLRHDLLICSDEIHGDLIYQGRRHVPIASLAPEIAQRAITFMAPSKTYNIAGLHCAIAIVPNADLRERMGRYGRHLVSHPGIMDFAAATAAYRDGQEWLDQVLAYLQANRDLVTSYVRQHWPQITVAEPEGTYLAWIDFRPLNLPEEPCAFFLKRARVALGEGPGFGPGGQGFVRLNFASSRAKLIEGLERMRAALDAL